MKSGRTLIDLATELDRQLASKKDLIVPSSLLTCMTGASKTCALVIREPDGPQTYDTTELARRQLAEKLKIPFAYFERMREQQPALLDRNINTWLGAEDENRMIRTLDGKVRAVLSSRYRRLDNFDLAEHILPVLQRLPGARFESVELTDTRMYLKVVTPAVEYEVAPGDIIQAGVVVSNSEVGCGSLAVQPLIYRLVCRNGLIASDRSMRKTHIGKTVEAGEEAVSVFKDDTLLADDRAFFLKVRDVVEAAVSEATFRQIGDKLQKTLGIRLTDKLQKTLGIRLTGDPVKTVAVLGNRYGFNEAERTGVLRHLIEEKTLSGYGLVSAVTGYSQEIADYDRATEFELLGGKLIDLSKSEWQELEAV